MAGSQDLRVSGGGILTVYAKEDSAEALCDFAGRRFACVVGRGGVITAGEKREGDGCTPLGRWAVLQRFYRPDRVARPGEGWEALAPEMGWCDAVGDVNYNRPVKSGYAASHEEMWREDAAYDYVLVLDHNQHPVVDGAGSAIFLHVWREGAAHTAGCVALKAEDLAAIAAAVDAVEVRLV
ncbi:MAG: L,D-transpeptidase family protein [Proteobacteria bacterium]|nr:L,D-transpeptidase family protein [Pseudomonadota bacterium]